MTIMIKHLILPGHSLFYTYYFILTIIIEDYTAIKCPSKADNHTEPKHNFPLSLNMALESLFKNYNLSKLTCKLKMACHP